MKKNKRNLKRLMSVLTSDRDTAKLYVQNNTRSKH